MSNIPTNPTLQSPLNRSAKDKFIMNLELPYILRKRSKQDPSLNIQFVQMSIFGTVVPDVSVPETDVRFAGQNLHLSTYARPSNPPLSINFIIDNEYNNYLVLWKWLDAMNLALDNSYGGSRSRTVDDIVAIGDQFEYQTNISILALNEYNKSTLEFNYTKAFISRLGGITYSYRDGNLIEGSADFHFSQMSVSRRPGTLDTTAVT